MNRHLAVRTLILTLAMAIAALWVATRADKAVRMSQPTREVLARLSHPVEIRFYYSTNSAFEQHALELLGTYQAASSGKISVSDLLITNAEAASSAIADGVRPFDLEKGDAQFLGVVMQSGDTKETLPVLSPEFKDALEADLTRALERLDQTATRALAARSPSQEVDDATLEKVKMLVPDYKEASSEQARQTLQEAMLSDLHQAGSDLDTKLTELKTALDQAQSQAEQEKIRQAITQTELEHAANLKRIVRESNESLRALEQMKAQHAPLTH